MTGRKVTRRASMRRKSMRSPSVSRSSGSKTPRSIVSEPHVSGKNSFNNSLEQLNLSDNKDKSQSNLPANNSAERLDKSSERIPSYAAVATNEEEPMTSSELLANELAGVKIADEEPKIELGNLSKTSLNASKQSLNASKGSIADLAKNRSKTSLNELESKSTTQLSSEEAKKSVEELFTVPLDSTEKTEEPSGKEDENTVEPETSGITETAAAETSTEKPAEIQTENEEETKKSCLAQKNAKCRCVIS